MRKVEFITNYADVNIGDIIIGVPYTVRLNTESNTQYDENNYCNKIDISFEDMESILEIVDIIKVVFIDTSTNTVYVTRNGIGSHHGIQSKIDFDNSKSYWIIRN